MIEFEVKSRILNIGERKGQTVYYAAPKSQQRMTNKVLVDRIVRETSLSAGDVSNALISLSNVVCEALQMGMSVDLAELGSFRLTVSSKMMDTPEEVTVKGALNTPKKAMSDAAKAVELSIERPGSGTGTPTTPGTGSGEGGADDGEL